MTREIDYYPQATMTPGFDSPRPNDATSSSNQTAGISQSQVELNTRFRRYSLNSSKQSAYKAISSHVGRIKTVLNSVDSMQNRKNVGATFLKASFDFRSETTAIHTKMQFNSCLPYWEALALSRTVA